MLRYHFLHIARRIDKNLMDTDIHEAFKLFDADGGGDISFKEFEEVLRT
jgi:Ca2+-binding EF-hand superfamily protein